MCAVQLNSRGDILNDSMFRSASSADYIQRAAKVVTLVDLAGHERYFKTTAYGLTGHLPDYACLIVSANNGPLYLLPPLALCQSLCSFQIRIPSCTSWDRKAFLRAMAANLSDFQRE